MRDLGAVATVEPSARDAWGLAAHAALRRSGRRSGQAREAVIGELVRSGAGVTAQELAERLRRSGRPSAPASVYRSLSVLQELDLVRGVDLGDGRTRWELVLGSGAHHHHIVCERCGRTDLFDDPRLETILAELESRSSYEVVSHDVVLRGRCPRCAATR